MIFVPADASVEELREAVANWQRNHFQVVQQCATLANALQEARRDLLRVNVTNYEPRRGELALAGIDKIDAALATLEQN